VLNQRHLRLRGDSPRCVCEWPEQFHCKISGTAACAVLKSPGCDSTRFGLAGGLTAQVAVPGRAPTTGLRGGAEYNAGQRASVVRAALLTSAPVQIDTPAPGAVSASARYVGSTAALSGASGLCHPRSAIVRAM